MKTEVKFRELPEKVQGFLLSSRVPDNDWIDCDTVRLDWLHKHPCWNRATTDERHAYAEWRYREGVFFISPYGYERYVNSKPRTEDDGIRCATKTADGAECDNLVYSSKENKWAEIISDPEEKQSIKDRLKGTCVWNESLEMGAEIIALYTEAGFINHLKLTGGFVDLYHGEMNGRICTSRNRDIFPSVLTLSELRQIVRGVDIKKASPEAQQEFVKANPGMQHVEEPKAGDMVEAYIEVGDSKQWVPAMFYAKAIHENRMWDNCYVVAHKLSGRVDTVTEIRLPKKSEVESKAKELIKNFSVKDDDMQSVVLKHDIPALVEAAIKWGQANPGKI